MHRLGRLAAPVSENIEGAMGTPLPVIANVARVVTRAADRITGDRGDYPLMVAEAAVQALKKFQIESRVMYGKVAWIEVLEDHSVIWAGCWGEHFHFWVATQYGEVVDLNTSVAHKKQAHTPGMPKAIFSPPILWSAEVPKFYRYDPEGVAEIELEEERDKRWHRLILEEIDLHCGPKWIEGQTDQSELDFPNEAILCPGRKLLDDSNQSFRQFDRALAVRGIPQAPF